MKKISVGIVGYGNLGKGVEHAIQQNDDLELFAVFTRRNPNEFKTDLHHPIFHIDDILDFKDDIDVLILCGGSATDLPIQVPLLAKHFNTVDSFDTHAEISNLIKQVQPINKQNDTVSIVSVGWDPGLFSMNRLLGEVVLPQGNTYTFWGHGVSQGHSDAIRRIKGVKNAVQYTVPIETAIDEVRSGSNPNLSPNEKHKRICYVAIEEGVEEETVRKEIVTMPNYFSDYDTIVYFVTEEELIKHHNGMPHGGFVIRSGESNNGYKQTLEFSLKLESNPMFTASVLVAYARAAYRFSEKKDFGAKTVFDVPLTYLSPKKRKELVDELL